MAKRVSDVTIVLVGPGRVGRAFARSWTSAGGSIVLAARRARTVRGFAREIGSDVLPLSDRSIEANVGRRIDADVLILAVPDDSISTVARSLARRVACRFAFHFSGARSSAELASLSSGGAAARLASVHPLRAFTGSKDDTWKGAWVAVEGDPAAARVASEICRRVGARPHAIEAAKKPLYHAAATLAAGGAGSLLSIATRLWAEAGLPEDEGRKALSALAATAIGAVERLPFDRALTGPVARRDVATVRLHRRALAERREDERPDVALLYSLLADETLRRTPGRGAEREIARILAPRRDRPATSRRAGRPGRNPRRG